MKDIDVNGYSILLKESEILKRISFELEDLLDEGGTWNDFYKKRLLATLLEIDQKKQLISFIWMFYPALRIFYKNASKS